MDILGPIIAALIFIVLMGRVSGPARRSYNAVLVAGASAAYLSGGGFGVWELPYVAVAGGVVAYLGLRSYRFIGLAWLMHSAWDLAHHRYGNPLWPFMERSSMGCAIFDAVIAIWFWWGAPALFRGGSAESDRPRRLRERPAPQ